VYAAVPVKLRTSPLLNVGIPPGTGAAGLILKFEPSQEME